MKLVAAAMAVALMAGQTSAECPNGCSGNGVCGAKDQCHCFKNYQGNDCSERTCPFNKAFVDTPRGDLNMDGSLSQTISGHQVYPTGTYETTVFANSKAHQYMECSNAGLCDRSTGECGCFEGYEGASCQRMSCPNACNGHGSCESMAELATKDGTTYAYWDENKIYGCKCDKGYSGADCSERTCKEGADPMFLDPIFDSFAIDLRAADLDSLASADIDFTLTMYDENEVAYPVTIDSTTIVAATFAAEVQTAIRGIESTMMSELGNEIFSTVVCTADQLSSGTALARHATANNIGFFTVCEFQSMPRFIKTPIITACPNADFVGTTTEAGACVITAGPHRGEIQSLTSLKSTVTINADATPTTSLTITALTANADIVVAYEESSASDDVLLVRVAGHYAVIKDNGGSAPVASDVALTFESGAWTGPALTTGTPIYYAPAGTLEYVAALSTLPAESNVITFSGADKSSDFARNDIIFVYDMPFEILSVNYDSTDTTLTLDRNFPGQPLDGTDAGTASVFKVASFTGQTYGGECAQRGICDRTSGLCQCFKGFWKDNCSAQNIHSL